MDNKSKNTIFMIILIAIGVGLFIMVSTIEMNLDNASKSITFRSAIKSIWIIATAFIIIPISFFICRSTCSGTLSSYQKIQNNLDNLYLVFLGLMGVSLITSGVLIKNELDLNNNSILGSVWGIIGLGIASCLIPFGFLVVSVISSMKRKKSLQTTEDDIQEQVLLKPDDIQEQVLLKPDDIQEQVLLKPEDIQEQVLLKPGDITQFLLKPGDIK